MQPENTTTLPREPSDPPVGSPLPSGEAQRGSTTRRRWLAAALGSMLPGVQRAAAQSQEPPGPVQVPPRGGDDPICPVSTDVNILQLISKATFGYSASALWEVQQQGYDAWLERQLAPSQIAGWESFEASLADPEGFNLQTLDDVPGDAAPGQICNEDFIFSESRRQLVKAAVFRAVYSPAQLFERTVAFWTDHFNTWHLAAFLDRLKTFEDRDVIRRHALGNFRDLLLASAISPAMLIYLDGRFNWKYSVNENYAREMLELHTLGVNNYYDQQTVEALAHALTGWLVDGSGEGCGVSQFILNRHDNTAKSIPFFGGGWFFTIPAGRGMYEIEDVIDILANPTKMGQATARFVGEKLCKWFHGYEPPEQLLEEVVDAYVNNYLNGDIPAMIRVILSQRWIGCSTQKVKQPFHLMASALRAMQADLVDPGHESYQNVLVGGFLGPAGHIPYNWPSPNGYPDRPGYWSSAVLARWNFGASLAKDDYLGVSIDAFVATLAGLQTPDAVLSVISNFLFGGFMPASDRQAIASFLAAGAMSQQRKREAVGLALASPGFQVY